MDYAKLQEIEHAVFLAVVDEGVLLAKGSWFRAQRGSDTELFFRTTFAAAPAEKIVTAVEKVGKAIRREFGLGTNLEGLQNGHAK